MLGNIAAFLIDPVNEVVGLFNGNPARRLVKSRCGQASSLMPTVGRGTFGFAFTCTF